MSVSNVIKQYTLKLILDPAKTATIRKLPEVLQASIYYLSMLSMSKINSFKRKRFYELRPRGLTMSVAWIFSGSFPLLPFPLICLDPRAVLLLNVYAYAIPRIKKNKTEMIRKLRDNYERARKEQGEKCFGPC